MSCDFQEHLVAFLDGELPEDHRRRLEEHLGRCSACARELDDLRSTRGLLDCWPEARSADEAKVRAWRALTRGTLPAAGRGPTRTAWTRVLVRYALPVAAAAAIVVLATVPWRSASSHAVPDALIAELPVLQNLDMLEAMDILTEWDTLEALDALDAVNGPSEESP